MSETKTRTGEKSEASKTAASRDSARQPTPRASGLANLQQAAGNQALQALLRSGTIQAKLTISQPGDEDEREADRLAEQVLSPASLLAIQHQCATCSAEAPCPKCQVDARLQRKDSPEQQTGLDYRTDSSLPILQSGGQPLPAWVRGFFEPRFGQDFNHVRIHTGSGAAESARAVQAKAFTTGNNVVFGAGKYAPESREGQRLLAHELTHVVQQRAVSGHRSAEQFAAADNLIQRDNEPHRSPSSLPSAPQPTPATVAPAANPATAERDQLMARFLNDNPGFVGITGILVNRGIVEEVGGLRALERDYPNSYPIIRERMIRVLSQETFSGLYQHDETIMRLVNNSQIITDRLSTLQQTCLQEGRHVAYDWMNEMLPNYELNYADAASLYHERGNAFLFTSGLMLNDPEATIEDLWRAAEERQSEYSQRVEAGRELVGSTIAERDVFMWFDDTVTLQELLHPQEGVDTYRETLVWATISGYACAVMEVRGHFYIYELNHQYSLEDVLATGFERRSELLTSGDYRGATIATTDGVILNARDSRYFVGDQTRQADENLAAEQQVLAAHGESLSYAQGFLLFRQMVRDLVLSNLAEARLALNLELGRFFEGEIVSAFTLRPEAGAELQRDTAALRRHMIEAANLANSVGESPTEEELARIEETLAAIGRIHQRNPTAALMITAQDDEDRVAGMLPGDAAIEGARELMRRLDNIERVENHVLQNADAVLDMTPLHDQILNQFPSDQRMMIQLELVLHSIEQLAETLGMAVFDLALTITGFAIGGPWGLAIHGVATARGISQTIEGFERVELLEAMTELDLYGDFALATPEMVSDARTWAWIGVGLTLLDAGGFVREARHLSRLQSVLASPDLAQVLAYVRRDFGEAAAALGKSERQLARELSVARGAQRVRLVEQIREALESRVGGGRYGYLEWDPSYRPEVLNRMRATLLADTADIDHVVQAANEFGAPLDRATVDAIKRYNFDSPGLAFSRLNYEAWMRLSTGRGTIGDVRYLVHEAAELSEFGRRGFDPMPANWASMGRHARSTWHRRFHSITASGQHAGHYVASHAIALSEEFEFIARQVNRLTEGRVTITREVAAAVDNSFSGENAREFMRVDDYLLMDHPNFYAWQSRADEVTSLSTELRARLGADALFHGALEAGSNSLRAGLVRGGADPTLRELISIVKRMRI